MKISKERDSLASRNASLTCRCAAWVLCVGSIHCVSAVQAQHATFEAAHLQSYAAQHPAPAESADAGARWPNAPAGIKRSFDQGPVPARVVLENGKLTVEANNSDLAEILKTVAGVTGMIIEGNIRSSRVFGVYGPRIPRDVLTDLLEGSGSNFMMVGGPRDGAPRELLLSAEKTKSASEPVAVAGTPTQAPSASAQEREQLGPGAIAHVPPPPPEDPQERVRQNLQRLQQMHDKLKEGNAPR